MKLIVSVSRDVLESVEASQICICNVIEDTIGWSQEAALSPGIHASVCLQIVGGVVVYIRIFGSLPFQLESTCTIQTPKRKLRKEKIILRN